MESISQQLTAMLDYLKREREEEAASRLEMRQELRRIASIVGSGANDGKDHTTRLILNQRDIADIKSALTDAAIIKRSFWQGVRQETAKIVLQAIITCLVVGATVLVLRQAQQPAPVFDSEAFKTSLVDALKTPEEQKTVERAPQPRPRTVKRKRKPSAALPMDAPLRVDIPPMPKGGTS